MTKKNKLEESVNNEPDQFDNEESDRESLPLKGPIISYGADYTLDTIRQYVNEARQIIVQPSFQRKFVWDIKKASKLIESFILGYPVPNILLGRDPETEVMEVIDGQQRILSICDFFKGSFRDEKVFKLTGDIDVKFENKTFDSLGEAIQSKLRNAVLKAVVLVYPKEDPNIKFTAFQRINTGSVVLNQQEIRNCIYGGNFNDLLFSLNEENQDWRSLLGSRPDKRMKDVETILRFFAAYFNWKNYEKPITKFLNDFMSDNKSINQKKVDELAGIFNSTISILAKKLGKNIFPRTPKSKSFNRAVFESVACAVARLQKEKKFDSYSIKDKYGNLLKSREYLEAVTSQTSDKKKYNERMKLAYKILS